MISRANQGSPGGKRTRAAPAAKKVNGGKLGNPRDLVSVGACGRQVQTAAADEFVVGLIPLVRAIQNAGATTLEAITCALNERGGKPIPGELRGRLYSGRT